MVMKRKHAAIVAVLAIAIALALWVYQTQKKNAATRTVVTLVNDAGQRLRAAGLDPTDEGSTDHEAHARAVDTHVAALRRTSTASVHALADAADSYLISVREILRRRAAMQAARARLAQSSDTLAQHLRSDRGRANWPREAVQHKTAVDRDWRDLRIAAESYVTLLQSFPPAQERLGEHLPPAARAEPRAVASARQRALDVLEHTDDNMRRLTQLEAYRATRSGRAR